jgi:hypothetical protein
VLSSLTDSADARLSFMKVLYSSKVRESYGHQEYNTDDIKKDMEKKIMENKDFIGRKFKFHVNEKGLPDFLLRNKNKYKHLFK